MSLPASIHKIARGTGATGGASVSTARPAPFRFPYREHRSLAEVWATEFADAEHDASDRLPNGDGALRSHPFNHAHEVANG